jgi:oligoendopeptidase F
MKSKNKNRFLTYKVRNELPVLKSIKKEWDLASLYYKDSKDDRIEADLKTAEAVFTNFAKKWRQKPFTTDIKLLKNALTEYEALNANPALTRPSRYFWLRSTLNTNDEFANEQSALIQRRLRKVSDLLLFFPLELGKISKAKRKELLENPLLTPYRYYLERLFIGANYHLSEPEEKIINLKSRQSYGMWVDMTDKIINNRCVKWEGKSVALPEAFELIAVLPMAKKNKLWQLILIELKQIGEVAEHEFNAIITDTHTEGEKRGYKKPYSATAIAYEDTESSLENLLQVVSTKGFTLSRNFYALKAKFHGLKQLRYAERNTSAGEEIQIPWDQAVQICRDVFYSIKTEYGQLFDKMLSNGQIDVFPRKGKSGGAFMSSQTGHPIHVMLNHTPTFSSLETLAHEMGHAIHAHCSSKQSAFYDGHSIITAETASTLFENLVFDAVLEQVDDKDKLILLHDRLIRDVSTTQRQIAFFNAELDIHKIIIEKGSTTNKDLAKIMTRNLQAYLGKAVNVTVDDGYSYVAIPHLRYGFYVYTYSYGLLMSSIMANRYKADNKYIDNIDKFLHAGASAKVSDIFASVGIDTTKVDTFVSSLKEQELTIKKFAGLI